MNKTCATIMACLPFCAGLLCSCSSTSSNDSPRNGENSQKVHEPWGTQIIYRDASGSIVRIEKRGRDKKLLPGACIVQFSYTNGDRVAEQNLNSQGSLVCNSEGYAITKYGYLLDPGEPPVVEETFYDQNNQPVVTKSGFAMMTCTENPDGRINTIHFSDFQSRPAPSLWDGVPNVVDVQYYYLQGVTPILCGVFWDATGNIISRKQLRGLTSEISMQAIDTSGYYVPTHTGGFHGGGGFHGH